MCVAALRARLPGGVHLHPGSGGSTSASSVSWLGGLCVVTSLLVESMHLLLNGYVVISLC